MQRWLWPSSPGGMASIRLLIGPSSSLANWRNCSGIFRSMPRLATCHAARESDGAHAHSTPPTLPSAMPRLSSALNCLACCWKADNRHTKLRRLRKGECGGECGGGDEKEWSHEHGLLVAPQPIKCLDEVVVHAAVANGIDRV